MGKYTYTERRQLLRAQWTSGHLYQCGLHSKRLDNFIYFFPFFTNFHKTIRCNFQMPFNQLYLISWNEDAIYSPFGFHTFTKHCFLIIGSEFHRIEHSLLKIASVLMLWLPCESLVIASLMDFVRCSILLKQALHSMVSRSCAWFFPRDPASFFMIKTFRFWCNWIYSPTDWIIELCLRFVWQRNELLYGVQWRSIRASI